MEHMAEELPVQPGSGGVEELATPVGAPDVDDAVPGAGAAGGDDLPPDVEEAEPGMEPLPLPLAGAPMPSDAEGESFPPQAATTSETIVQAHTSPAVRRMV
jgi:hypothetical protein